MIYYEDSLLQFLGFDNSIFILFLSFLNLYILYGFEFFMYIYNCNSKFERRYL